ncbi:MAG TPA: hypothetical protein VNT75_18220 [Symbiobacteriaceae bacterium]|nr:hypothetical protein [Symbiobacteriaceae bacterium]
MAAKLVTYESDLYGVSFSYPENLSAPAISEMGLHPLKLDLGNGEISIYRREAEAGKSLADLVAENIDANTKASHGRIVSKNLGRQTLGGNEAWAVQRHFDSAAGRYDAIQYIVLKGGFEYSVTCRTKQGPPVIPWQLVEPACQRILATISFMER